MNNAKKLDFGIIKNKKTCVKSTPRRREWETSKHTIVSSSLDLVLDVLGIDCSRQLGYSVRAIRAVLDGHIQSRVARISYLGWLYLPRGACIGVHGQLAQVEHTRPFFFTPTHATSITHTTNCVRHGANRGEAEREAETERWARKRIRRR